jgi:hypothetical protein
MDLYKEYIKEREGKEMVYDDHCFLTYKMDEEGDIIVFDIYSDKEVRGTGYMLEFCNKFYDDMREKGVKVAYGMTDTRANGWERSEQLLLKYGFIYIGVDPRDIHVRNYCKEL